MNNQHLLLIETILSTCAAQGIPIWLSGGWAIDARLRRITRPHDDIDLTIPAERMDEFKQIISHLGARDFEIVDYGFLAKIGDVLLDCEPCFAQGDAYEIEGTPAGSCPQEKQGHIQGLDLLCTSWQAILWDYFYYLAEVPYEQWPQKDKLSYSAAREAVGGAVVDVWEGEFLRQHGGG